MENTVLHLDAGSVTILLTLLVQSFGIVWWAATISSRTQSLRKEFDKHCNDSTPIWDRLRLAENISATLLAEVRAVKAGVEELKVRYDRHS